MPIRLGPGGKSLQPVVRIGWIDYNPKLEPRIIVRPLGTNLF